MSKRTEKRCRFRNEQKEQHLLVNARRQADHQACVANLPPERILYLTLDIGKNVNWSRADTDTGRMVIAPQEFSTSHEGYLLWRHQLRTQLSSGQFDLVILGHEPTGIYHEAWARQILSDFAADLHKDAAPRLIYRMLNPYQVKLERIKLVLRSRKSDQIDLLAMRNLLQQGQGNPAVLPTAEIAALNQSVALSRQACLSLCRLSKPNPSNASPSACSSNTHLTLMTSANSASRASLTSFTSMMSPAVKKPPSAFWPVPTRPCRHPNPSSLSICRA